MLKKFSSKILSNFTVLGANFCGNKFSFNINAIFDYENGENVIMKGHLNHLGRKIGQKSAIFPQDVT